MRRSCLSSAPSRAVPVEHGILAPAARLDRWLLVVLVVLLVTCAVRYADRHALDATGLAVLAGAVVLGLAYATRGLVRGTTWWPTVWVTGMVVLWGALTAVAPSFAWCAVPVAFAALQVLPFAWAVGCVVAMTVLLTAAWQRITDGFDPVQVAGPIGVGLVTVLAYRALDLETRARQAVVDQLVEAQAELAEEQHRTGALAERTRLSREIHDSVGQGLSSINLLLQAAEQAWTGQPETARGHVRTAAATARDGLDEVRRVVRDLAPAELTDDASGAALAEALERAAAESTLATAGLDGRGAGARHTGAGPARHRRRPRADRTGGAGQRPRARRGRPGRAHPDLPARRGRPRRPRRRTRLRPRAGAAVRDPWPRDRRHP